MLKEELAPFGVRVYSVAPDFMQGGMNSDIPQAFVEMIKEKSPTRSLIDAGNVARAVSYVCSDRAKKEDRLTFIIRPGSETF